MEQRRLKDIYDGYEMTVEELALMQEWQEECRRAHEQDCREREISDTDTLAERTDDSIEAAIVRHVEAA